MKRCLLPFALMLLPFVLFAQNGYFTGDGGAGKVIMLKESVMVNGKKDNSDSWLSQTVKNDIFNDLVCYSAIKMIDPEQQKTIIQLQRESESMLYGDDDALEIGKLLHARAYISVKTTHMQKDGEDLYNLSAAIINIETGDAEGGYSSKKYYTQMDYILKAHGEVSSGLLEQLGVELTPAGKRLLEAAATEESSAQKSIATAQENIDTINAELGRLQDMLAKLAHSDLPDTEAVAEQFRIQTQQAMLRQQEQNEQEKLRRLQADAEKRAEEEKLQQERDAAQQQRIDTLAREIEEKAAEMRRAEAKKSGVVGMLSVIEKQKQVYEENRDSIEQSIQAYNEQIDGEWESARFERTNRTPRVAEVDASGSLTESARRALQKDLSVIDEKYKTLKTKNEATVRAQNEASQKQLEKSIRENLSTLSKTTYTATSLIGDDLFFDISSYDGTDGAEGWEYEVAFYFEGQPLITTEGKFTYAEITGKNPVAYPEENAKKYDEKVAAYYAYIDEVEAFDSFFRTDVPYIKADMTYIVSGRFENRPKYYISIIAVTYTNLQTGKVIRKDTLANYSISVLYNAVDESALWMPVEQKIEWNKKIAKQVKKSKIKPKREGDEYEILEEGSTCVCDAMVPVIGIPAAIIDIIDTVSKHLDMSTVLFFYGKNAVSQQMFEKVMGYNPSAIKKSNAPVTGVDIYDAIEFCNKASLYANLIPCYTVHEDGTVYTDKSATGYRLPTVEEWKQVSSQLRFSPENNEWCFESNGFQQNDTYAVLQLNKKRKFIVYSWGDAALGNSFRIMQNGALSK